MAGEDDTRLFPQLFKPGVKRDGPLGADHYYTDAEWCRFEGGLPRKMGGWRERAGFTGPVRTAFLYPRGGLYDIYGFSANACEYVTAVYDGGAGSVQTRAFDAGFTNDVNNTWQVDLIRDTSGGGQHTIVACGAPNALNIDNRTEGLVQFGDANDPTAAFTDSATSAGFGVSGGILALHPYLVAYGNDGLIYWSDISTPQVIGPGVGTGDAGNANVAGTKLVVGKRVRGSGSGPQAVLWSLDEVIRMSYVGGTAVFRFDTISSNAEILSHAGVVEYDGLFFWPGRERFLVYNGTVRELPNQLNADDFFENINYQYRNKVWGTKVPRYGEIWWFYPRGTATECNAAIIYNVRENTWYDPGRRSPGEKRSAGVFSNVFRFPSWFCSDADEDDKYKLNFHETGVDEQTETSTNAIKSSFTTGDFGFAAQAPTGQFAGQDMNVILRRFEPDVTQTGDLKMDVLTRRYRRGEDQEKSFTVTDSELKEDTNVQGRYMRLRFTSNVAGGDYEFGESVLKLRPGDKAQ